MRKSFDALRGLVKATMMLEALSGHLFVFRNQRGDRLKVLYWDGDGFALWYKYLQRGTFQFPDVKNFTSAGVEIDQSTLRMILDGIDLSTIKRKERFRVSIL
jgi:transposase